jgi:hypothetical protein
MRHPTRDGEDMKTRISALMDGELEGHEIADTLKELRRNEEMRSEWCDCQLIGAALRDERGPGYRRHGTGDGCARTGTDGDRAGAPPHRHLAATLWHWRLRPQASPSWPGWRWRPAANWRRPASRSWPARSRCRRRRPRCTDAVDAAPAGVPGGASGICPGWCHDRRRAQHPHRRRFRRRSLMAGVRTKLLAGLRRFARAAPARSPTTVWLC